MERKESILSSRTRIGLTVGQVVTLIILLSGMFYSYGNFAVRLANIENKNIEFQSELIKLKQEINTNRVERIDQINQLRLENRDEHRQIMEVQNKIYDHLIK